MTVAAKLKWEEITKWVARIGMGATSILVALILSIFNETRSDIKKLLNANATAEERYNGIEKRVTHNEIQIDKLRDQQNEKRN